MSTELAVTIAIVAVGLSILLIVLAGKRRESGYVPNAVDGDKDGKVQEGTVWEREEGSVKIVPAKPKTAPVKKTATAKKTAPAKKAAPAAKTAKKAPAKKAAPKKK